MQEHTNQHNKHNGRWTKQQHLLFLQGLRIYGRNCKKIESLVQTRSGSQIRSHAQKFFIKNRGDVAGEEQEEGVSVQLQDEQDEVTRNSKSMGQIWMKRDDYSYYCQKILQYTNSRSELNFWQALVDCKGMGNNGVQQTRKKSFQSLDLSQNLTSQSETSSKIKV